MYVIYICKIKYKIKIKTKMYLYIYIYTHTKLTAIEYETTLQCDTRF